VPLSNGDKLGPYVIVASIAKWPYDIWMLEGFDQAAQKTWLDRLLRR